MMREFTVAVVGGGASGVLSALAFMRRSECARIIIIDPSADIGRGVAYSTECRLHLLNVPAEKMSAFPDQPDHFMRWLHRRFGGTYTAGSFVPRWIYGSYLSELAAEAQTSAGSRWRRVATVASHLRLNACGVSIVCSNGETVEADFAIIASGNPPAAVWSQVAPDARASGRFFASAWDARTIIPSDPNEEVLLLGSGLTAVDVALGLRYNGHRGTIHMVSRRGLLPHEHRIFDAPPPVRLETGPTSLLLKAMRARAREGQSVGDPWRAVVDGVRSQENALWQTLSPIEQRRFFRHAAPYWNVHRHRMAPAVAKAIAELMAGDALRVLAGRIGTIALEGDALRASIRLRGSAETLVVRAGRVINCSGPEYDFRKVSNPLIQNLLEQGLMVASPLNIGVMTGPDGTLISANQTHSDRLFAVGPARYGTLIETTAIPEIRVQAHNLADVLVSRFQAIEQSVGDVAMKQRKAREAMIRANGEKGAIATVSRRSRTRRMQSSLRDSEAPAYFYEI